MKDRGLTKIVVIGLRGLPGVIGGIETHCEQLYPAVIESAEDIDVRLLVRRAYAPAPNYEFAGVRVTSIWSPANPAIETLVHTLLCLFYARLRLHPRIVHFHGIGPAFFVPLARLLGFRTVVTHHATDYDRPKWSFLGRCFLRAGEALAACLSNAVICVSDALREEFLTRFPAASSRTLAIPHGAIPLPHDPSVEARTLAEFGLRPGGYVLAVGRLDETKRFHDLVAATHLAGKDALPLVIVGDAIGDGAYGRDLRKMSGDKVIFTGFRSGAELAALYRGAALFIHPSAMEGFGLVVLEALAAGTGIKLSDIPAHREFGLPEDAYFAIGDVDAISQILAACVHRAPAIPDTAGILARYDRSASVLNHVRLFRAIGSCRRTNAARGLASS